MQITLKSRMLRVVLLLSLVAIALSFRAPRLTRGTSGISGIRAPLQPLQARRREGKKDETPDLQEEKKATYEVGVDVPEYLTTMKPIYDMILVERFSVPTKTQSGLFMPTEVEGADQKHLGVVLAVPADYGLESEQGRIQPIAEIAPYKVGDKVYIRVSL
jgi:co-chaperonin GroES (HSP10)